VTAATAKGSFGHRSLRVLVGVHRWLGVVLGALVVAWFLSGFVMLWHGMPALAPRERLEALPRLDLDSARVDPAEALARLDLEPDALTVGMLQSRPVYRVVVRGRPIAIYADTGAVFQGMSRARALELASQHLDGGAASGWRHHRIEAPDQWTLQSRALLPMHRFAFEDPARSVVYVSERTGEVALVTDRGSRRWGFLGPVVHWVYFTPIRRHSSLWLQGMIGASLAGVVLVASGLAWGAFTWLRRRRSPYQGWLRWHHTAGLVFGLVALAWMLSGLLSLDPWEWHPGTSPSSAQRAAARGGGPNLERATLERLRTALEALAGAEAPRELEVGGFDGDTFVLARGTTRSGSRLVAWLSDPAAGPAPPRQRAELEAAARRALPDHRPVATDWLERGDAYYYARTYGEGGRRPLPVLRVRFDDRQATALYVDPLTGSLLHREQRSTRVNRWLYHGLHSWDHPWLLERPVARIALMVTLLCGGLLVGASALVPGCRRLRAALSRSSHAPPTGE
jgi:hypothetical protein